MKTLSYSLSNYLIEIYRRESFGPVHVTDLAEAMDISKASVCRAVKHLAGEGLVLHESYGPLLLSEKGKQQAELIRCKRAAVQAFLVRILGVSERTAESECSRLEAVISETSTKRIEQLVKIEVMM